MSHATPHVHDAALTFHKDSQEFSLPIESEAWWQWLSSDGSATFRFTSEHGSFTARREYRKGGWYWYAYRKQQGKLHKAYIGKSIELTADHMNEIAQHLSLQASDLTTLSPETKQALTVIKQQSTVPSYATHGPSSSVEDSLLLTTKLLPPPIRPDLVARSALIERLNCCSRYKLTLLTAPAGSGKTTLLSAWQVHSQLSPAWLSLDSRDNDPARFWHYTLTALQKLLPSIDEELSSTLRFSADSESFLTSLINTLVSVSQASVLVFDDFHVITNQTIYDTLAFLLDHLPTHLHLIIASRSTLPVRLTRLRAQGQLLEFYTNDLCFTLDETTTFLQKIMELDILQKEITYLHSQTEGWIAGLQLAALSMRQHNGTIPASFKGDHHYIIDYLTDEVLRQLPTRLHDFLLHTSLLERLSASLCEAVTGHSDSQETLEYLERANLFLIPLDEQHQWYRYHHLFAEFLQTRLNRTHADFVPQLHRRAAEWYRQHGLISATINHAFATGDALYTAHLLEDLAPIMLMRSEIMAIIQWLHALPEHAFDHHPRLHLYMAGCLTSIGQLKEAEVHLCTIESFLKRQDEQLGSNIIDTRQLKCEFFAARSAWAAFQADSVNTLKYAQAALQFLSKHDIFTRSLIITSQGCAYLLNGDFYQARDAFVDAASIYQAQSDNYITLMSIACQGYIQMMHGHLHQASETLQQAIQLGTRPGGRIFAVVSIAYVFLGEIFYEHNKLDEAEHYAQDGIAIGKRWGYIGVTAWGYRTLALVQLARGDTAGALALTEQIEKESRTYSFPLVTRLVAVTHAYIQLRTGTVQTQWGQSLNRSSVDVLIFPYEFEHVTLAEIYLAQGRYNEASTILEQLRSSAEEAEHIYTVLQCFILQALVLYLQGHLHEAINRLSHALSLAEPEGYIRIFVDKGEPMAILLQHVVAQGNMTPFVLNLLAALGITKQKFQKRLNTLLSEREQFVLRAIATGKSNQEIASDSVVAISTIKTHINNIYTKLGVRNRTQALARAHELGML